MQKNELYLTPEKVRPVKKVRRKSVTYTVVACWGWSLSNSLPPLSSTSDPRNRWRASASCMRLSHSLSLVRNSSNMCSLGPRAYVLAASNSAPVPLLSSDAFSANPLLFHLLVCDPPPSLSASKWLKHDGWVAFPHHSFIFDIWLMDDGLLLLRYLWCLMLLWCSLLFFLAISKKMCLSLRTYSQLSNYFFQTLRIFSSLFRTYLQLNNLFFLTSCIFLLSLLHPLEGGGQAEGIKPHCDQKGSARSSCGWACWCLLVFLTSDSLQYLPSST